MMRNQSFICILLMIVGISTSSAQIRQSRKAIIENAKVDYSKPKKVEIGGIKVDGLDFLDPNTLISLSGLRVGDKITVPGQEISDAIKKLWKHGLVDNVSIVQEKIEQGKVHLIIKLTERPRLRKFEFIGANRTQEKELADNISIYRGKVLTDAIVKNSELVTKKFFVEKGFLNTEVTIRQKRDTILDNHVILVVEVDKKSKVKVEKLILDGNVEIPDGKLKGKLKKTGEAPRFTLLGKMASSLFTLNFKEFNGYFQDQDGNKSREAFKEFVNDNVKLNVFKTAKHVSAEFNEDKKSLIAYYNTKGYRDARIISDSIYNVSNDRINIKLSLDEGKRYYIRDIYWTGNYVYQDNILTRTFGLESGSIFNRELIDKKLNFNPQGTDISGLYLDNGYLFFKVEPIEWVEGDSIDLEMRMFEGEQATINNIIINGNDRTNDHVIQRELRMLPGAKFSRQNLIRDQQALSQLGYFDPEQISIQPLPNPADGTVDMEYNLVERPSDQIELSGGWGGFYGFVGTLGLSFNNFSLRNIPHFDKWRPLPIGDGQKLSIRAQANGRQFQNYALTFVEPWLGGKKRNSFSISLNNSIQRRIDPFTNEVEGTLNLKSITVGFGKQLNWPDNYFTINEALAYTVYGFDNWTFNSLGFEDGTSKSLTFTTTLARHSTDSPMYPKSGSSIQMSLQLTPPWSLWKDIDYENADNSERYALVEYHKWMFDFKHYTRVVGDLVIESRAHFGFIGAYNQDLGIGPFERFFLGGDGLAGGFNSWLLGTEVIGMRGYENNVITPPNYGLQGTRLTQGAIDGGIVYNKFSFELRYPVTTGQAATIYILGFTEAGNNWDNYSEFDPFNLYKSAGFGARIFMPAFGLIGLNWGYGFDTLPGRSEPSGAQFHFTIGQQLR